MDIDQILFQAVSKDNSTEELKGFILSQGPRESANEHLVPEQLFDDPKTAEKEVEGVSAVKAIQIAQQQGQTIYTITRENYAQVLPRLQLSSTVMTDIRDAINAGRTVTTHEKSIQYKGWHGSGYIIIDPHSGAGAYLIDGGANGAIFIALGLWLLVMTISLIEFSVASGVFYQMVLAAIGFIVMGYGILTKDRGYCEFGLGMVLGGTIGSIFGLSALASDSIIVGAGIFRALENFSFLGRMINSPFASNIGGFVFGAALPTFGLNKHICGSIRD